MKILSSLVVMFFCAALSACGGGGGTSSLSGSSASSGSGSGGSSSTASNAVAVIVDAGPNGAGGTANEPFVTVTICSPTNPTVCQTIDHILVDTGSFGLRIISSVLSSSLNLPLETDSNGNTLAECTQFADGYSWGPIRTANLQIGSETANSLPIQIIGDSAFSGRVPQSCMAVGTSENTVSTFGANGVIGLGPFAQDCGNACAQSADNGFYYACGANSCQMTAVSLALQVPNPVTMFKTDNNGSILSFASVPADSTENLSGTLTFGVDTQTNNALGNAKVYTTNQSGYITTEYNGATYADSLLDSGSNGLFFNDDTIAQCSDASGFYCPSSTLTLSAVNLGQNGNSGSISFAIGNADSMFNNSPNATAFSQLGGVNGDAQGFDWGLPFFFGRSVYTVVEGYTTSGGTGPYFAY